MSSYRKFSLAIIQLKVPEYHEMWPLQELVWRLHLQTVCISLHTSLPATQPETKNPPIGQMSSKVI